jgi:murein DD-endopeptidase MepM/ murein hydrolase activator NlpD
MSRSLVRVSVLASLLITAACTQTPAQVDLRGHNNYGRSGEQNYASDRRNNPAPVVNKYASSGSTYRSTSPVYTNNTKTYSAPVSQTTEQSAGVQSIGVSDLAPPSKNDKSSDAGKTVNPWTNKQRSDAGDESFSLSPRGKTSGGKQMISEIAREEKPVAQLESVIEKEAPVKSKEVKLISKNATLGGFMWPVNGKKIVSGFGPKGGGRTNDGINIASAEGEPVWASADGEVVYVGNELKGYGNMIIIKHSGGKSTTYAHLNNASVEKYDRVKQGDIIGYVGSTGNVKSPQLHFAIRQGKEPVNPRKFLKSDMAGL